MIDWATGWIYIRTAPSTQAVLVSSQVDLACLTRYELPSKATAIMKTNSSWNSKPWFKLITAKRNAHINSILERDRQTIGNIIRIFKVQNMVLNNEKPLDRTLASTIFALRTTVHTSFNVAYPNSISARMGFNIEHTSQSKLAVNSQT